MSGSALGIEVSKYQLLKKRLLTRYADVDEETVQDTLEGITNLHEMIAAIIRSALIDEALQAGLRTRIRLMRSAYLQDLDERGASGSWRSRQCVRSG